MKCLILIAALLAAAPAYAADKPIQTMWYMVVQLKFSSINAGYQSEEKCREAVKLVTTKLKGIGRADCLPVLQQ